MIKYIKELKKRIINVLYPTGIRQNRTYMNGFTTLKIDAKVKLQVKEINEIAKNIIKKCIKNPEQLLKFVESKGTIVIKAPYMDKVLLFIGEGEGFVTPQKGLNALILSIAINILSKKKVKIGFQTQEMFAMRNLPANIFLLSHQFHHWLAYKKRLPGYDIHTMNNFKNIWFMDTNSELVEKLTMNEILDLKEAIARDIEAIDFVKSLSREFVGAKESLEKIKQGEKVNL